MDRSYVLAQIRRREFVSSLEAHMMYDYVRFGDLVFWRPTLAHMWAFNDLISRERPVAMTDMERKRELGFIMTFDAAAVRNEYRRLLDLGTASTLASQTITLEHIPVIDALLSDLERTSADDNDNDEDHDVKLPYGWWCSIVNKIAAAYHWPEREIFAIPITRLNNYLVEINLADGIEDLHSYPADPELDALQQLLVQIW